MTLYLNYQLGKLKETTHEYKKGTKRSEAEKEANEANQGLTEGRYYVSTRACNNWRDI
jgi:uncharacterized protein HemY